MTATAIDFTAILTANGIPVTEDAALAELRKIAAAENAPFNNLSAMSPFGRLLSLLFVKPLIGLLQVLAGEILPALFLQTATGSWVDVFAWQLGLTRKTATKARGLITLTRYASNGTLVVPAGTIIQSAPIGGTVYRLLTVADATFAAGQTTLSVVADAEHSGSAYNLATGFYALIATSLAGIASVSNASGWLITPGADAETDDELKARCRNQFSAVNRWNVDAVYKSLVAGYAGIGINDLYIEKDAPRGAGTANIYVLSDEITPSAEFYAQITATIKADGTNGLGDDVVVLPIPTRPILVTAKIRLESWLTAAEKAQFATNITNFILVALRGLPTSVGYAPTRVLPNTLFSWSRLIRELHNTFDSLVSIDFATDADLQPDLWVTNPTVNVELIA